MTETAHKGRRVVVGLSGGVDSSVAALLLLQHGYEVHALHMTNWEEDEEGYCSAAEELQDARRVCEHLGVPLHHVNFAPEYRERVFEDFLADYRAGYTPNPDVLCNREIKFGVFREYARRLGAELIATGHYARVEHGEPPRLRKGTDPGKDQSYFLHQVATEALAETLFPLGALAKAEVRRLARDHGLPTHDKRDSTGICFIGERPFREFLSRYVAAEPGPIVDEGGREIGRHQGLPYYTPGQRQGLGIGGRRQAGDAPWYVAARDFAANTLVAVQGSDHPLLYSESLSAGSVHWIGGPPAEVADGGTLTCSAKVRYRQADQACRVRRDTGDELEVRFDAPQRAVAPGQFVVFYRGEVCLGGGRIRAAHGETGHRAHGEAEDGPRRAVHGRRAAS
ncbi:tRNA 2-thiouridine(34) synthase MnmA [Lentisalinibacter salinarum]|uniref:tRNA 2-thiouridine(34) synthase MnmA n=1 Tax=Lentisalinibacter salinarum TaxID=2992239 RepID=UPI00386F5898